MMYGKNDIMITLSAEEKETISRMVMVDQAARISVEPQKGDLVKASNQGQLVHSRSIRFRPLHGDRGPPRYCDRNRKIYLNFRWPYDIICLRGAKRIYVN